MRRVLSKLQNYYDRRRVGKLARMCNALLGAMQISLEDFLGITDRLSITKPDKGYVCRNGLIENSSQVPSVKIFQIYYLPDQLSSLEPAFEPYEWLSNPHPEYTETLHFVNLYESGRYKEADYTGIVSSRFGIKTSVAGKDFIQFIKDNPGYDVYFVNPFPELGYFWHNIWSQGEFRHPGLTALAQNLFEATNTQVKIHSLGRNNHNSLLYCNYWIGNNKFWDAFMGFIIPLFRWIDQEAQPRQRKPYFRKVPYAGSGFAMFSFIFERLFSTFMMINKDFTSLGYRFSTDEILTKCGNTAYRNFIERYGAFIDRLDQLSLRYDNLGNLSFEILKDLMALKTNENSIARLRTELHKL
ncbi:MAG: hypothetical protein WCP72_11665 [Desulfomonile sp.]